MYQIVFGFLYLLSLLPFRVLYIFSDDIAFIVYHILRYRRDVVANNLLIAFPEKFAFHLAQVYGLMDNDPAFGKSAGTMFQMSLLNHAGFDSYMAGPPVFMQRAIAFVLTPATRLFGFKSYYPAYDIRGHAKN